mgnify:FL=1
MFPHGEAVGRIIGLHDDTVLVKSIIGNIIVDRELTRRLLGKCECCEAEIFEGDAYLKETITGVLTCECCMEPYE